MATNKNEIIYTANVMGKDNKISNDYSLCANFNSDMPQVINWENRDTTWDYSMGQTCFTFPHLPAYPNVNPNNNFAPKPIYNQ